MYRGPRGLRHGRARNACSVVVVADVVNTIARRRGSKNLGGSGSDAVVWYELDEVSAARGGGRG